MPSGTSVGRAELASVEVAKRDSGRGPRGARDRFRGADRAADSYDQNRVLLVGRPGITRVARCSSLRIADAATIHGPSGIDIGRKGKLGAVPKAAKSVSQPRGRRNGVLVGALWSISRCNALRVWPLWMVLRCDSSDKLAARESITTGVYRARCTPRPQCTSSLWARCQ